MVFFLKIPTPFYDQGRSIPGRELARIIPPDVLYERDGYHWFQKEKIVKSYVLLRDAPELQIVGEGPPPETDPGMKCVFAILSLGLVLFQVLALLAIIFNTTNPSCVNNLQCGRVGTYCSATGGTSGRCAYCGSIGDVFTSVLKIPINATVDAPWCDIDADCECDIYCSDGEGGEKWHEQCAMPANIFVDGNNSVPTCPASFNTCTSCEDKLRPARNDATAFCADRSQYSADYCDHSTANDEKCAHPACRACPGSTEDPNPGWGVPYHLAIARTGSSNVGHHPISREVENSTWGITSEHTVIRDNVAAMQYSDYAMLGIAATAVSFNLASEIRDIALCEITIHDRGGGRPWRWRDYLVAIVGSVVVVVGGVMFVVALYLALHQHVNVQYNNKTHNNLLLGLLGAGLVGPSAVFALIDGRVGNSPWRVFLLATNALRRFSVVPLLSAAVPMLVLFDVANAKDMALNTVGALFLLSVDNEAFAYALPDHIRTHVEEYGRAEVGAKEAGTLNAVKTWTWIPQIAAMVLPVLAVKHLHDPVDMSLHFIFVVPYFAMFPGLAFEALAMGGVETATKLERAAVGVPAVGFAAGVAALGANSVELAILVWLLDFFFFTLLIVLWCLDRRDGRSAGTFRCGSGQVVGGLACYPLCVEVFVHLTVMKRISCAPHRCCRAPSFGAAQP